MARVRLASRGACQLLERIDGILRIAEQVAALGRPSRARA
jgi:hypothetical protein